MTKEERAEKKAGIGLHRLFTTDVGTRFWKPGELEVYLREVVQNAGFKFEGNIRPFGVAGEQSVMVRWPGARSHHYLTIRYQKRESGLYAATAGLGRV
jgi:hypothetical protein